MTLIYSVTQISDDGHCGSSLYSSYSLALTATYSRIMEDREDSNGIEISRSHITDGWYRYEIEALELDNIY